jgi:hypothetical protein
MSFFGSPSTGTKPQKLTTLSVQTSAYGVCIPMVWGTARVTGNMIWYGDFVAKETHDQAGGKGGSAAISGYAYSTAFALALLDGQTVDIPRVWSGKDKTTLAALGLDLKTGAAGQSAWSYLATKHASEALNYPGITYVGAASFALGSSASMPNLAFEVKTGTAGVASTPDAAPWGIVYDLVVAGGMDVARLGDLTAYTAFCAANGLFLSPALTEQKRAADHIQDVLDMTHTAAVASEGKVKLIPFGDAQVTGNGYTFTPTIAPVYDLTDDDFLPLEGPLPIRIKRKAPSDAKNRLRVEFKDRANDYATGVVRAEDESHIAQFGPRAEETLTCEHIKVDTVAQAVAYLKLQRGLYVLNTYEFRLSWRYCLLEPMDIVTLTHSLTQLGLVRKPVRILTIEEDAEGGLSVMAEDFPQGAGQAPIVAPQTPSGYSVDMNVAPGNAAAPVLFEPPVSLAGQPEIWMATSGGATFGGADVWVSLDNVTYQRVGTLAGKARHGMTTATLPLVADPDTTSTLAVDLSVSGAQLLGGTADDRDLYNTLCWVGGELVSYKDAALTGANQYSLTSLRRGVYGTTIAAHASASKFVRCDDRVFRYPYDSALVGKTLYVKLQAFNIYGGAYQDLASLTPTAYAVQGAPLGTVGGLVLEQPFVGTSCAVKWAAYPGAASYTVEVWAGSVKRRTVTGLASTRFAYSFEDGKADGGPFRNLEIRAYAVAANGTSGSPAVVTAANPQIGVPTGIATVGAGGSITVTANKPSATDYAATRVWISTATGFDPSSTSPVYDGPDTYFNALGLASGTYYVRVAQVDVFGADGMTTSGELTVNVTGVGGVKSVTALPSSPAGVGGDLAVFLDSSDANLRGLWGWDGSAWKFTRDGANLVVNSVTADKLAVSSLAAISANLGTVTSGAVVLDAAGFFRGGQTYYNTGNGFWMGYSGGAYKFSLGNSTQGVTWDGSDLTINGGGTFSGALSAATGTFAGSLSSATGTFAGALSAATGSFSGALSAATGTFAGTLTASAINAVDTINIAGNAVTVPMGAEWSGSTQAGTGWVVSTPSADLGGGSALVSVSAVFGGVNAQTGYFVNVYLRVFRDQSLIREFYLGSFSRGAEGAGTYIVNDYPGVGSHGYQIGLRCHSQQTGSEDAGYIKYAGISVLGAKR